MDLDADVWWGKNGMKNPLAEDVAEPVGEYPGVPARSGVTAVLKAADAVAAATAPARSDREQELQRTVDDIRTWCHGKHTVGAVEILNIIGSHHV